MSELEAREKNASRLPWNLNALVMLLLVLHRKQTSRSVCMRTAFATSTFRFHLYFSYPDKEKNKSL